MSDSPHKSTLFPTSTSQRHIFLDALRGFALLGVCSLTDDGSILSLPGRNRLAVLIRGHAHDLKKVFHYYKVTRKF